MKNLFYSLLLCASAALANDTSVTGFLYTTQFGDKDWQNGRNVGAVNVDYFTGNYAIRTQLSSYNGQHIRRAVAEYSHPIGSFVENTYQIGRFSRLDSFYEGVTDNPSNYRQALLPFAGYSYRMFNGAFVIMDGVQMQTTFKLDGALLKTRLAYGEMSIPVQDDIQKEAFRRTFDGYKINSANNNYDVAVHYETKDWHAYVSRNHYKMDDSTNGTPTANFAYSRVANIDYRLDKAGVKYDNQDYVVQVEWFHDITGMWNPTGKPSGTNNAVGFNWMTGLYLTDQWLVYGGRSYGRNKVAHSYNDDNYVGVSWFIPSWTLSAEWHQGNGFAWRKYDAPFVPSPNVPSWNTYVVSATYRF